MVIKAVVLFKWDTMVKFWFKIDFALTIALAIFYLLHPCAFECYAVYNSDGLYDLGVTLLVSCFGLSVYFGFREVSHIANNVMAINMYMNCGVSNIAPLLLSCTKYLSTICCKPAYVNSKSLLCLK